MRSALLLIAMVCLTEGILPGQEQTTFEFHSGFWFNLHHVLYNQATGKREGREPDLAALSPGQIAAWNEALDYYDRNLVDHDLLEIAMGRISRPLADAGDASSLGGSGVSQPLAGILEKAAPVYREHWWTEHNRKNHEWIEQVSPLIAAHEKALRQAFSHAYDTPWPKGRIRVEMSYYTTKASAYTMIYPTLITISSWSQRNVGPAGLETIFHESGHGLIQKVQREIAAEETRLGRKVPQQKLWHGVLFYTAGELVRGEIPELVPYAIQYGMWEKAWPNAFPVLEKDWKPFLQGKGHFKESIDRVVADCN